MKEVYMWGAGFWADYVYENIKCNCRVLGLIDSDITKQGKGWKYNLNIFMPEHLQLATFDYLVITIQKYNEVLKICMKFGIPKEKIIVYWRDGEGRDIFENRSVKIANLEWKIKRYECRLNNFPYEYGVEKTPVIHSSVELLNRIITTGVSLSRFGDGEFELMLERERPWFQSVNLELAERLRQIISADEVENIIVAIADDFGCLEKYTEEAADGIRMYMTPEKRKSIMKFIDMTRKYYDAYVTRPYLIYKDRKNAENIFLLFKKIWDGRSIVLVEGENAGIGIGNDLFSNVIEIKRILCPQQNAWNKYREIMEGIHSVAKPGELVCVSLGPTATVITYDLAKEGIQAIDIGQLDNEYEWVIRNAENRMQIPGKMTAEVNQKCEYYAVKNSEYLLQVVKRIV